MVDIENLPVYQHKDIIIEALRDHQVIVVESPTGSGKTTQIPKILFDAGFAAEGRIGVTQPRRIAAVSVSHFIARQYREEIPGMVGYKMRFVDETVEDTRIVIMTDGILLQEVKGNPYLSDYDVIMVDEAHERSLNIDFILGLLKGILRERSDLKVVISSATINAAVFSEYFDGCPVVSIDARMYPVQVLYAPPEYLHDYSAVQERILEIVRKIEQKKERGDILIFLSGEGQIKSCIMELQAEFGKRSLALLPLYGRLSQEEQERVFDEFAGKRKIIVSTNIAETSVTIDGVRYVIDPGFAKLNYYNTRNFTSSLVEIPISKASCNQRKGRAGRTAPGICYRLYTRESYNDRELFTKEEIYRRDLSEVILRMVELGIHNFEKFDFLSHPGGDNIQGAIEVLRMLDAIDEERQLTPVGDLMVKFPIIPRLSRMIVAAIIEYPDVLEEVLIAASFLNDRAPFLLPHGMELEARKAHHSFRHSLGDFVSYLRIYRAFVKASDRESFCDRYYLDYKGMNEIFNVKGQLSEIVSDMGIPITGGGELSRYLCAVSKGLLQFLCKRTGKSNYSSLAAYGIKIHPGSVMFRQRPEFIVAGEIMRTSQMYAMSVSPLTPDLIGQISRDLYDEFVMRPGKPKKKAAGARDFTSFVKIGGEKFTIEYDKKKRKIAVLPFEKIYSTLESLDPTSLQDYRGMRGKVMYRDGEILSGMNLLRILQIVPKLGFLDRIVDRWPKGAHFEYVRDSFQIVRYIPFLLQPCRKTKSKRKLGFLTLLTDGNGVYWYSAYRDFLQSLEESISSLEALIDEDINILSDEQEKTVNEAYRRMTTMLSE